MTTRQRAHQKKAAPPHNAIDASNNTSVSSRASERTGNRSGSDSPGTHSVLICHDNNNAPVTNDAGLEKHSGNSRTNSRTEHNKDNISHCHCHILHTRVNTRSHRDGTHQTHLREQSERQTGETRVRATHSGHVHHGDSDPSITRSNEKVDAGATIVLAEALTHTHATAANALQPPTHTADERLRRRRRRRRRSAPLAPGSECRSFSRRRRQHRRHRKHRPRTATEQPLLVLHCASELVSSLPSSSSSSHCARIMAHGVCGRDGGGGGVCGVCEDCIDACDQESSRTSSRSLCNRCSSNNDHPYSSESSRCCSSCSDHDTRDEPQTTGSECVTALFTPTHSTRADSADRSMRFPRIVIVGNNTHIHANPHCRHSPAPIVPDGLGGDALLYPPSSALTFAPASPPPPPPHRMSHIDDHDIPDIILTSPAVVTLALRVTTTPAQARLVRLLARSRLPCSAQGLLFDLVLFFTRARVYLVLLVVVVLLALSRQRDAMTDMAATFVVEDRNRPGLTFLERYHRVRVAATGGGGGGDGGGTEATGGGGRISLRRRRPVIIVPGLFSTALELWETNSSCLRAASLLGVGTFRQRMFSPQMIYLILRNAPCWLELYSLDRRTGLDRPGTRIRPDTGFNAVDYVAPGVWLWAKIFVNFADIGYDPQSLSVISYDWRADPALLQRRDGLFYYMRNTIVNQVEKNRERVVIVSHSFGVLITVSFLQWAEARRANFMNDHVAYYVNIGGPALGLPKALLAMLTGDVKDSMILPLVLRRILERYFAQSARYNCTRSWSSLMALLPRGCPATRQPAVLRFGDAGGTRGGGGGAVNGQRGRRGSRRDESLRRATAAVTTTTTMTTRAKRDYATDTTRTGAEDAHTSRREDATDDSVGIDGEAAAHPVRDPGGGGNGEALEEALALLAHECRRTGHWYCARYVRRHMRRLDALPMLPRAAQSTVVCLYGVNKETEVGYVLRRRTTPASRRWRRFGGAAGGGMRWRLNTSHGDGSTVQGVRLGDGDGTVPLMTLGYMCRARNGWSSVVGRVVTREFRHDGAAMRSSLRLRGHVVSGDHVDLLGNFELIETLMKIATGVEEEEEEEEAEAEEKDNEAPGRLSRRLRDRIYSDIDARIEREAGECVDWEPKDSLDYMIRADEEEEEEEEEEEGKQDGRMEERVGRMTQQQQQQQHDAQTARIHDEVARQRAHESVAAYGGAGGNG